VTNQQQRPPVTRGRVTEAIKEAIMRGDFVPGQRLVEADLSELFDASRASVRSALLELTHEGLVEKMQNRGARVRAVSLDEAIEISEVRMLLEALCAAKAAERIDDAGIAELQSIGARMRSAVAEGDVFGYSGLNQLLHRRLRELGEQQTAAGVLDRLRAQSVRHQFRLATQPGRPAMSLPEHLAIIEAVCARDADAADQAVRAHLASVMAALRQAEVAPAGSDSGSDVADVG
jgi:DNA-binding GntR family transcriptional regulator